MSPDLIATLRLVREGSTWLAAEEGYIEAVRYLADQDGSPRKIEIRAELLKDYLCARNMALRISFWAQKDAIVRSVEGTDWTAFDAQELTTEKEKGAEQSAFREWHRDLSDGRWEGKVISIHEGGHPVGSGFAVLHVGRKNFDSDQSVPEISPLDEMKSSTRKGKFAGPVLYRVLGEIWRDQWVQPASASIRVRGDEVPSTCFFIVDAEGARASDEKLRSGGRWLWFSPAAINSSLAYRGSSLSWHTRETGRVAMARDGGVAFGVNDLGLLNVYAKDVAYMPPWQRRIWSGFNVAPDGGVCRELLASQAEGVPAGTLAPEAFLLKARDEVDQALLSRLGYRVFRSHSNIETIASSCHRFRSLDRAGLFELAKDLARITADDIDSKQLQKIVPLEPEERRGSLMSLERVIAKLTTNEIGAVSMSVLFAIYEMRLADAHLASSETDEPLRKIGLNQDLPYVQQGRNILISLVDALFGLARAVRSTPSVVSTQG